MHAEGGLLSLDVDCAREMFARSFNKTGGIIGIIGDKTRIHAMISLLITRWWYTRENHLEEIFAYVHPDYRKSNYARTLIEFAKKCSDEIGIPLVIGVMTNSRIVEKVRLYRRSLGFPAGAVFVYNGNWINERPENSDFWHEPFPRHTDKRRAKINGKHRQISADNQSKKVERGSEL
jgi:GNAT superfamily N-acetyltransferase